MDDDLIREIEWRLTEALGVDSPEALDRALPVYEAIEHFRLAGGTREQLFTVFQRTWRMLDHYENDEGLASGD